MFQNLCSLVQQLPGIQYVSICPTVLVTLLSQQIIQQPVKEYQLKTTHNYFNTIQLCTCTEHSVAYKTCMHHTVYMHVHTYTCMCNANSSYPPALEYVSVLLLLNEMLLPLHHLNAHFLPRRGNGGRLLIPPIPKIGSTDTPSVWGLGEQTKPTDGQSTTTLSPV